MNALRALVVVSVLAAPLTGQTHVLVVAGLGGDAAHRAQFHEWSLQMVQAAKNGGVPDSHVVYLGEKVEVDPANIADRATKENIEQTLRTMSERAGATDGVLVVLFGHGSYQGEEAKFSLPGPDMTALDFAAALAVFPTQSVTLVNTASASGDFIQAVSGERRTVITATKSSYERNETVFPRFFVEAFTKDVADTDKDERLSILEAYEYARLEVERFYGNENRLLTEHAQIDDNGDGEGSAVPDPQAGDGAIARRTFVVGADPAEAVLATDDPELAALYKEQQSLQQQVAELRALKDQMDPAAYEADMERLLVALARTSQAIRAKQEKQR